MMTTNPKTSGRSHTRAKNEEGRDIRIDVLDIDALLKWAPPGSVTTTYRFPIQHRAEAEKKLRNAGFTVRDSRAPEPSETEAVLEISRHYGMSNPDADTQREQWDAALAAMRKAGVSNPVHVSHGITLAGGNPLRPWVQATIDGQPIDHHFEAGNEGEVERNLDWLFSLHPIFTEHNITRDRLSYVKPEGWPVENWPLRGFIGPTEED
jgi:hypothetical protein